MDVLQSVLPPLPEDVLHHIASYLDIDTRRMLGMPPRRLTSDRYAPLANLYAPIFYNIGWAGVSVCPLPPFVSFKDPYRYKRSRRFHTDGTFLCETITHTKPLEMEHRYANWFSTDLNKWSDMT
jgi:hypothetical protein